MPVSRQVLLVGVAAIILVVIYFQMRSATWADVIIIHYDGRILKEEEFDSASLTGTEILKGRKVRGYFRYIPERHETQHPVVRAYLNGDIVISNKAQANGENIEQWRLCGSLNGPMKDVIPGKGTIITGSSHSVAGWTIEWWEEPTSPAKVIIITNPDGKSRTFKIEWTPRG